MHNVPVMNLTYFKRYRMEIDLARRELEIPPVRPGYRFVPWDDSLLDACAKAKYLCFRDEIDVNVFPCLGELEGCRRLMNEIRRKQGFLPGATWLVTYQPDQRGRADLCGTIQGVRDRRGLGAIQNVGITPAHRGTGLGTNLILHSLEGFRQAGLLQVYLEVTSQNTGAIRLYRRLGFQVTKTVYKAVEAIPA